MAGEEGKVTTGALLSPPDFFKGQAVSGGVLMAETKVQRAIEVPEGCRLILMQNCIRRSISLAETYLDANLSLQKDLTGVGLD